MTIYQGQTTSFKQECLLAVHDFRATGGDTFKIALYSGNADIGPNTTAYTASGEVTGTNYTAGGTALTNLGTASNTTSQVGYTSFSNVTFTNVTLTARGALIYNTTPSATAENGASLTNPSVAVLDFGSDKTATAQNLTIQFPANAANTAIVRIGNVLSSS